MKMDMAPILSGKTTTLPVDYPLMLESSFPQATFTAPASVRGEIRNNAGYISLRCRLEAPYETVCDRCMLPITRTLTIDFDKTVAQEHTLENEDSDDYVVIVGGELDIDPLLTEEVILEFPSKHLCREDCKGLCPKCGKDLNEGPCDCKEERRDPKWDAIRAKLDP